MWAPAFPGRFQVVAFDGAQVLPMGLSLAGYSQIQITIFTQARGFVRIDSIFMDIPATLLTGDHFAVVNIHFKKLNSFKSYVKTARYALCTGSRQGPAESPER